MFEYAALVDAPVQRFTGIVTGDDQDAERLTLSVMTPAAPVGIAVAEAPVMLVAASPAPIEVALQPIEAPTARPVVPVPAIARIPVTAPRPQASRQPSILPAVVAIAATAVATTLWLRRGLRDHDR